MTVGRSGDMTTETPKIAFQNIEKRFGRVVALEDITLEVDENEIFALVGDNGAGKSTLMHVLCGAHEPTSGTLSIDGTPVEFSSPNDARQAGIETVYQDLALMNDLDVATNVFMGQFPKRGVGPLQWIDWETTYEDVDRILTEELGKDLNTKSEVEFLSGGERQLVAIARALAFDPDIIILDEPTSALSVEATELVHDVVRQLRDGGRTIIVVSHSVDEVLALADRVGVLYQGQIAGVEETDHLDRERVTDLMVTGSSNGSRAGGRQTSHGRN